MQSIKWNIYYKDLSNIEWLNTKAKQQDFLQDYYIDESNPKLLPSLFQRKNELIGHFTPQKGINIYTTQIVLDSESTIELQIKYKEPFLVYVDNIRIDKIHNSKNNDYLHCKLKQGRHQLSIKCINFYEESILINILDKENNNIFNSSLKETLDFHHILNGTKIVRSNLSPTGKYILIEYTENKEDNTRSFKTIYDTHLNKKIHCFNSGEYSNLQWLNNSDKLSYTYKNKLFLFNCNDNEHEILFDLKNIRHSHFVWAPNDTFVICQTYTQTNKPSDAPLEYITDLGDNQFKSKSSIFKFDIVDKSFFRITDIDDDCYIYDINFDSSQILISKITPNYKLFPFIENDIYSIDINTLKSTIVFKNPFVVDASYISKNNDIVLVGGVSVLINKIAPNTSPYYGNNYNNSLYLLNHKTKEIKDITQHFAPHIISLPHTKSLYFKNNKLYFIVQDKDKNHLYYFDSIVNKTVYIPLNFDVISSFSSSQNGSIISYIGENTYTDKCVVVKDSSNNILFEDKGANKYLKNFTVGSMKKWDCSLDNGSSISGRYYLPPNFDPNKKYPLIVNFYGGTFLMNRSFCVRYPHHIYANKGYVVYIIHPSGTVGFGQNFADKHQHDWGKNVAKEIVDCTKKFISTFQFIDKEKIGCIGASYGGFISLHTQTTTDIFKCAISHGGISSLSSHWGTSHWAYRCNTNSCAHSYPWNDPLYVTQSPLFNAHKINTPILLIHGENDKIVPYSESLQMYTALKILGKDVSFIKLKNCGHVVNKYSQFIPWFQSIISFFDKHLG